VYNCCDGKVSDIKALESSSYFEFCSILDKYLEKVDRQNKEYEKMERMYGSRKKAAKK
jgi:hypothetical protein